MVDCKATLGHVAGASPGRASVICNGSPCGRLGRALQPTWLFVAAIRWRLQEQSNKNPGIVAAARWPDKSLAAESYGAVCKCFR